VNSFNAAGAPAARDAHGHARDSAPDALPRARAAAPRNTSRKACTRQLQNAVRARVHAARPKQ